MKNISPVIVEKAFEDLASHLKSKGLKVEDNFRVTDKGMAITHKAAAVIKKTGFPLQVPSNKSIKGMGFPRDGSFFHPLSESIPEDKSGIEGGAMNSWMTASVFVNVAMGWMKAADATAASDVVRTTVSAASPLISVERLMEASKYSDPKLLKLIGLVKEGLETSFYKALNK